jgi:hypothetical protein
MKKVEKLLTWRRGRNSFPAAVTFYGSDRRKVSPGVFKQYHPPPHSSCSDLSSSAVLVVALGTPQQQWVSVLLPYIEVVWCLLPPYHNLVLYIVSTTTPGACMIYKNGRFIILTLFRLILQESTVLYTQEKIEDHICRHYFTLYSHAHPDNNSIFTRQLWNIRHVYCLINLFTVRTKTGILLWLCRVSCFSVFYGFVQAFYIRNRARGMFLMDRYKPTERFFRSDALDGP